MKNEKSQKTLQSPNERQRRKDPFQLLPVVREIHHHRFRSTERGGGKEWKLTKNILEKCWMEIGLILIKAQ